MSEEKPEVYEEWISHPDKRVFVLASKHQVYASNAGWWCTGWQGSADAVYDRGYEPQA